MEFSIYSGHYDLIVSCWKQLFPLLHGFLCSLLCKFGEGDGTPLQYSCLENPMDGGAWWAAVHGVARSRTQLSDFTFTFCFHALEKEMATHSSVLAWRIPGTGEPGGLLSLGLHRVGHDWSDLAAAAAAGKWFSQTPNEDNWQLRQEKAEFIVRTEDTRGRGRDGGRGFKPYFTCFDIPLWYSNSNICKTRLKNYHHV